MSQRNGISDIFDELDADREGGEAQQSRIQQGTNSHAPEVGITPPPDDSLARFRLRQDFGQMSVAKKKPLKPALGRPDSRIFIRTKQGPDSFFDTKLLELPDKDYWLVDSELFEALANESALKPKRLYVYLTPDKQLGIWPLRIIDSGNLDSWNESAHEIAAGDAAENWVRVESDASNKCYRATVADNSASFDQPDWTGVSLENVILDAFEGKIIDSLDHQALLRLRRVG